MKYWIGKNIYLVPPVCILLTLAVSFIDLDASAWVILGNTSGYSILVLLPFLYFYLCTGKYCDFTKLAVIGLFVIAVYNSFSAILLYNDNSSESYATYERNFSILICTIVLLLSSILYLKKR